MSLKINNVLVGNECFPNNERIYRELDGSSDWYDWFVFDLQFETNLDLMTLMFYKKYVADKFPGTNCLLRMYYVPYSRMDREIEGYIFSLKYFADFINDLKFDKVEIVDPHSNVTPALLNNCETFDVEFELRGVFDSIPELDYIFYPDVGALKRYGENGGNYMMKYENFFGYKARDLSTGKITHMELVNAPDLNGKKVLIIDDLCSKGGTFIAAAKLLKEAGAENVYLYVTHCENSIFNGEILTTDWIDTVYTTDSIFRGNHPKIVIV
jgi:ribose-phosphate pyrophosphokinase